MDRRNFIKWLGLGGIGMFLGLSGLFRKKPQEEIAKAPEPATEPPKPPEEAPKEVLKAPPVSGSTMCYGWPQFAPVVSSGTVTLRWNNNYYFSNTNGISFGSTRTNLDFISVDQHGNTTGTYNHNPIVASNWTFPDGNK